MEVDNRGFGDEVFVARAGGNSSEDRSVLAELGLFARFAAFHDVGQRTVWHAWIGFSQADLMRSQPVVAADWRQRIRWSGGAADGAQEPRSTAFDIQG